MEDTESDKDECLREDVFIIHYPHCSPAKCQVTLTPAELILEEHEDDESDCDIEQERFKIEDIFGIHVVQKENEEPSLTTVYVCLIFYTSLKNSTGRSRVPRIFEISESQRSYKGNLEVAKKWTLDIAGLLSVKYPNLYSHELQEGSSGSVKEKIERAFDSVQSAKIESNGKNTKDQPSNSTDNKSGESLKLDFYEEKFTLYKILLLERNYLVIINPVSGQAKGLTLFKERISPVFFDAGINVKVVETEFPGHAHNTVKKFDLSKLDGIVSIGGDGVINEIVNGLRNRDDFQKFADIPIGVVATGSGNGLARSIAAYCGASEEYLANPVLSSSLCIARGCVSPVNLVLGWGLLSDIDIESEVLRYIGEIRFFIWSFIRLIQLRRYKAELSYVPLDAKGSISSRVIVNDDFVSVYSACQSWIGSDMLFAPDAQPFDSTIHLNYLPSNTGRLAAAKFLAELSAGQGKQIDVSPGKYVKVKEFTIRCEGGIEGCLTVDGEQVKGEEITVKMSDTPLFILAIGQPEEA